VVPENIYKCTHPRKVIGEEGGSQNPEVVDGTYEAKSDFHQGRGWVGWGSSQNPFVGKGWGKFEIPYQGCCCRPNLCHYVVSSICRIKKNSHFLSTQ